MESIYIIQEIKDISCLFTYNILFDLSCISNRHKSLLFNLSVYICTKNTTIDFLNNFINLKYLHFPREDKPDILEIASVMEGLSVSIHKDDNTRHVTNNFDFTIHSLNNLDNFPSLKYVNLQNYRNITSLTTKLEKIKFITTGTTNDFTIYSNLTSLNIQNIRFDVYSLTKLRSLKYKNPSHHIIDILHLQNNTNLNELLLFVNEKSTVSLTHLTKLNDLSINFKTNFHLITTLTSLQLSCRPNNFNQLLRLHNLRTLYFAKIKIYEEDEEIINRLTCLECLGILDTNIVNIKSLTTLTKLVLENTSVKNIDSLIKLKSLKIENKTNLRNISKLSTLKELYLKSNNLILNLDGLISLTKLIIINSCNIIDINLTQLKKLLLYDVRSIRMIKNLPLLEELNILKSNCKVDYGSLNKLKTIYVELDQYNNILSGYKNIQVIFGKKDKRNNYRRIKLNHDTIYVSQVK